MTMLTRYHVVFELPERAIAGDELPGKEIAESLRAHASDDGIPVDALEIWRDSGWEWRCYPNDATRNQLSIVLAPFSGGRWILSCSYRGASIFRSRESKRIQVFTESLERCFHTLKAHDVRWFTVKPAFASSAGPGSTQAPTKESKGAGLSDFGDPGV